MKILRFKRTLPLFFVSFFLLPHSLNASEKKLFTARELKEVERLKTQEFINSSFRKDLQLQTRKKLGILIANATKAHKDFLKKEVSSDPWKQLNIKDHDKMMKALIEKELKKYHENKNN